MSVTTSVRRVASGGRATVTGVVLDEAGKPVVGRRVWLYQRHRGERWTRVSSAVTGSGGGSTFATGSLDENTFFRFRVDAGDADDPDRVLRSRVRRIGVQPLLTLTADGTVVSAQVVGARPGDAVTVSRRIDGRLVRIGIRQLDQDGNASYDLSAYSGRVRVQVRVLRTPTHTAVRRWITVRVPKQPPPTPSPSPSAEPSDSAGRSTTSGS